MRPIPEIQTARLILRGHRLEDLEGSRTMWGDPSVTRHIGGRPFTGEEVWGRLLRHPGHWALMGFGYWVVREKDSGRFVGEVGFADLHRDIIPSLEGVPEIGWVLSPPFHGKGLATEAARAAIAWCEDHIGAARTVCIIDPENRASIAVAAKCGYREFARTTYHGSPAILFERAREKPAFDRT